MAQPLSLLLNGAGDDSGEQSNGEEAGVKPQLVWEAHEILDSVGLLDRVWLVDGLVLGYHREGRPIGHDTDCDLGIHERDVPRLLAASDAFTKRGFRKLYRWKNAAGKDAEFSFVKDGVKVEFFVHYEDGDEFKWFAFEPGQRREFEHRMPRYQLEDVDFLDRKWRMPANRDVYLQNNYGPDWRVPDPSYDYTDCAAIVARRQWNRSFHWK